VALEQVRAAAGRFHGEIEQMPPPYSAKKIEGTPAYKLARAGKPVKLKTAKYVLPILRLRTSRARRQVSR